MSASEVGAAQEVEFHLVGVTYDHRQRAIAALAVGDAIYLHPMPDNPVDAYCVGVVTASDHQIGYLAHEDAINWYGSIPAGGIIAYVTKLLGGTAEKPNRGVIVGCRLVPTARAILPVPRVTSPLPPLSSPPLQRTSSPFSIAPLALGTAIGLVLGVATAALVWSFRDGPRQGSGWVQIGRLGADRVAVLDVVPFSEKTDRESFQAAITQLCGRQERCQIAFTFLRWPTIGGDPLATVVSSSRNEPEVSLLAFYRREADGTVLSIDCARYVRQNADTCLAGTALPSPPSAPARAPAKAFQKRSSH